MCVKESMARKRGAIPWHPGRGKRRQHQFEVGGAGGGDWVGESLLIPACGNICGSALVSSAKEHLVIRSGMRRCPHPGPRRSPPAPAALGVPTGSAVVLSHLDDFISASPSGGQGPLDFCAVAEDGEEVTALVL